jgi:hypothetical protein
MSRQHPNRRDTSDSRFRAQVRHYHRSGAKPDSSWDEWVDGRVPGRRPKRKWGVIIVWTLAVVVLVLLVAGLVVELPPR